MTPIEAAYDNIRLLRRKVRIAEQAARSEANIMRRDAAMKQVADLTDDLLRALNDFADLGFEEEVSNLVSDAEMPIRAVKMN